MTTLDATAPPGATSRGLRAAGWALHLYTASGAVLGLLAVLAAVDGRTDGEALGVASALVSDSPSSSPPHARSTRNRASSPATRTKTRRRQ